MNSLHRPTFNKTARNISGTILLILIKILRSFFSTKLLQQNIGFFFVSDLLHQLSL